MTRKTNKDPGRKRAGALALALGFAALLWIVIGGIPTAASKAERAKNSEAGYVLGFGPDFKPLLASRDDLGISVVLAIDCSGSMSEAPKSGGEAKYLEASKALGQVVEVLGRLVKEAPKGQVLKVGVLRFSDQVAEVLPLRVMDEEGIAQLASLVGDPANLAPGGSTAIGAAIEKGAEWLSQSGTILRSLIVVTDGDNRAGVEPSWALSAVYGNRNSASTPDYPVLTSSILVSFIGFDIDSGIFKPLAKYGARILSATNQGELAASLAGILEADITKLEAPALGGGK
jgi:hypothetical protein